ncbi:MAG: ribonuclease E/G [Lachnospiraceae bacterium]|nr:ribonuclease E/G [Lachnospiraceae bacterium]
MAALTFPEYTLILYHPYAHEDTVAIARLQEGSLLEYRLIGPSSEPLPGEIRLGRILKVQKALSAAFVDIGSSKHAFLPLNADELPAFRSGMELPVEVQKATYENKGASVTHRISFRTDHVVLSRGETRTGVSKKIEDPGERSRLKDIGKSFPSPEDAGYVLRTESADISREQLLSEAVSLRKLYKETLSKALYSPVGTVLYTNDSPLLSAILEWPAEPLKEILAEDRDLYSELLTSLETVSPQRAALLQDRSSDKGDFPISSVYRIPSQLEEALHRRVNLSGPLSGGYLFIEETAACCVIDVNTGKELSGEDKEESVTAFNCLCAKEIARQICLRNLSGVILIDFVDMNKQEDRLAVIRSLVEALAGDQRKSTIYGFTATNMLEMTRARKGKTLSSMMIPSKKQSDCDLS